MLKIYQFCIGDHDPRLLALAVAVCVSSAMTTVGLLGHARKSETIGRRRLWSAIAALSGGCGLWATHFIAVLAYMQSRPGDYAAILTLASLVLAIGSFAGAFEIALSGQAIVGQGRRRPLIGGAMLGLGIAAMHYTGMLGLAVTGEIHWDLTLVAGSLITAALFGALALPRALSGIVHQQIVGALVLSAAILAHYFISMAALSIDLSAGWHPSAQTLSPNFLATMAAFATFAVFCFAGAGLVLDRRERRRVVREGDRMRGLADAAVEGLLVCDGATIVTANASFAALSGLEVAKIEGRPLSAFIAESDMPDRLQRPDRVNETLLRHQDGSSIPVEVHFREIDFAGRAHQAIAVRDVRDRKQAEQRIRFLAHNDALTGLPNRAHFNDRLDAEILAADENRAIFAVLCLDIDRFKEINDLFGHVAGDEVLRKVARCVTAVLPPQGLMARLGGDEFVVLLPNIAGPSNAADIAEAILRTLSTMTVKEATLPTVTSSIGIALYPQDGVDRHSLLNHADTALYSAKAAGRATHRFFDAEMGAKIHDRRLIEHELRASLSNQTLRVVYQPQSMIETGSIVGFEALLRWCHPEQGDISPAVFIPIAEETGSILQIGHWVMRTACAEAARWTKPLSIAVNVSPVELHSPNYADTVRDILIETGLSPARLEIEITETAIIRDFNRALGTLRQLKALGIRIAMDDFGTGYSSLSNLRAFPFDKIKIDASFVREVHRSADSAAIVRAVLGLGRGLNLPILAEGVETLEELRFLDAERCEEAQGYLVGRPMPIETFRLVVHPPVENEQPAIRSAAA